MKPRSRFYPAFAVALLFSLCLPLAADPDKSEETAYFQNLPAANPYRDLLLRLDAVPAEDRAAIDKWLSASPTPAAGTKAPTLSAKHQALAETLADALLTASARARTTTPAVDHWPLYYPDGNDQNPYAALVPGIGLQRQLARLATKLADARPPGEALDLYLAAAQFGRHKRHGTTLIEQLTGVAMEGIAMSGPTRRLREFSPSELARLSAAWQAQPAPPDLATALRGERDSFAKMMKNVFLPPLLKALAEEDAKAAAEPDFTRDLRLSALINLGAGDVRVSLENTRTGTTFTLAAGSPAEGIELVRVDFEHQTAELRRGPAHAIVHLESRRLELIRPLPDSLSSLVGISSGWEDEMKILRWLDRIRHHPDGPDGYIRDACADFDHYVAQLIDRTQDAEATGGTPPIPADPFMAIVAPTLGTVGRSFQSANTQAVMLQAAIAHRLKELGVSQPAPADPWADHATPFTLTPTDDGGFTLRSVYEVRASLPVVYKYAAPDAGFLRVVTQSDQAPSK